MSGNRDNRRNSSRALIGNVSTILIRLVDVVLISISWRAYLLLSSEDCVFEFRGVSALREADPPF